MVQPTTVDFETRSVVDIKKAGAFAYAEHPMTSALCLAVLRPEDMETSLWVPRGPFRRVVKKYAPDIPLITDKKLRSIFSDPALVLEAHNTFFERSVWYHHMRGRLGFPPFPPVERQRDSMAKAAMHALPLDLDKACKALNLREKKDKKGHALMLKMSKPRAARKAEKQWMELQCALHGGIYYPGEHKNTYRLEVPYGALDTPPLGPKMTDELSHYQAAPVDSGAGTLLAFFHNDPEEFVQVCRYCIQDVYAEHSLSSSLRELPPEEHHLWAIDQESNWRGVKADLDLANASADVERQFNATLVSELQKITVGEIQTSGQRDKILGFLARHDVHLPDLAKDTVRKALERLTDMPELARRVIEIRRILSKTSTRKLSTILASAAKTDGRIHGVTQYHAAATGRFGGRLVQVQNLPRGSVSDIPGCIESLLTRDAELVDTLYGEPPEAISSCIRAMLVAGEGRDLVASDFSAIEARVLAWVANEKDVIARFVKGLDTYKVAAVGIFGGKYEDVTKAQRQVGKTSELALGYQGGIAAYVSMAQNYFIDLETLPPLILPGAKKQEIVAAEKAAETYLKKHEDAEITMEAAMACDVVKQRWRASRPRVKALWNALEQAAADAVQHFGEVFRVGKISYRAMKPKRARGYEFLLCRLPSGRKLYYPGPKIRTITTPWGAKKAAVTAYTLNQQKQWVRRAVYGGLLCENVIQAVARDVLAHSMSTVEDAGYPILMHVHDEIIAEPRKDHGANVWNPALDDGKGDFHDPEFDRLMEILPAWAKGLPIKAEGWRGQRYKK